MFSFSCVLFCVCVFVSSVSVCVCIFMLCTIIPLPTIYYIMITGPSCSPLPTAAVRRQLKGGKEEGGLEIG